MLNKLQLFTSILLLTSIIFTGCSSSKSTAFNHGLIQKRRYNKGLYVKAFQKKNKLNQTKRALVAAESNFKTDGEVIKSNPIEINNRLFAKAIIGELNQVNQRTFKKEKITPRTLKKAMAVVAKEASQETKSTAKELNPKVNEKEDAVESSGSGSGKSQLVALLLVIFVGVLGIHRFYLGYTLIGVIQLLTLGGCGIWSLIDLIMIITGDLKPMNGDYSETL